MAPRSTLELATTHPEAFAALPEGYQADDCLDYYEHWGILFCRPKASQVQALGHWEAFYEPKSKQWRSTQTGKPVTR